MWSEGTAGTQCSATMFSIWQGLCKLTRPSLRTLGQCLFVLAMLFIITGIALCIWGYLGTAIPPFQIFGPACIGTGVAIYVIGCILCCRDYPAYERKLIESERKEKAKRAIRTLQQKEVVEWIQSEPDVHEEFCQLALQIFNNHGLYSTNGNVIANLYVNHQCAAEV